MAINKTIMEEKKQQATGREEEDRNNQPSHNPVQAGKEAIAAGKKAEGQKPEGQQSREDKQDAERWRNEG